MAVPTFGSVLIGSSQVDAMKNWYRACFPDAKENEMGAFEFGGAALFVDPDNEGAIADRIGSVAADPETASHRATVARARVERFTLPQIATRYLAVYRDVLANRGRRSLRCEL